MFPVRAMQPLPHRTFLTIRISELIQESPIWAAIPRASIPR